MSQCDQCGRHDAKISRIYKDESYCSTCYAREFKPKPCIQCSEIRRIHRKADPPICHTCFTAKPCVRCGKTEFDVGKITIYGPVCNACSPYFRPKQPCEDCGKLSSRLSRVGREGNGFLLCPNCYQRARGSATCTLCRRYRVLVETDQGSVCRKCADLGMIQCSACHADMPAGMGKICESCSWTKTLNHRVEMWGFTIKSEPCRQAIAQFVAWLVTDVGVKKATITIERYVPFFVEAAKQWSELPTYAVILAHFKPKGMRQYLKVKQWLQTAYFVQFDASKAGDLAEQERIANLQSKLCHNSVAIKLLNDYMEILTAKLHAGQTSIKSIRLALQPVVGLMLTLDHIPTQADVDQYLAVKQGQKAALTGLINYLNKIYKLELVCQLNEQLIAEVRQRNLQKIEQQMIELVVQYRNEPTTFNERAWVKIAMLYFHQIELKKSSRFDVEADKYTVLQSNKKYFLPLLI